MYFQCIHIIFQNYQLDLLFLKHVNLDLYCCKILRQQKLVEFKFPQYEKISFYSSPCIVETFWQ